MRKLLFFLFFKSIEYFLYLGYRVYVKIYLSVFDIYIYIYIYIYMYVYIYLYIYIYVYVFIFI